MFQATERNIKFASDAIQVQNAVNPLGVLNALAKHMKALREESPDLPLENHPALWLFVETIYDKSGFVKGDAGMIDGDDIVVLLDQFVVDLSFARQQGPHGENVKRLTGHYLAKIAELVGVPLGSSTYYGRCLDACERMKEGEPVEPVSTESVLA